MSAFESITGFFFSFSLDESVMGGECGGMVSPRIRVVDSVSDNVVTPFNLDFKKLAVRYRTFRRALLDKL